MVVWVEVGMYVLALVSFATDAALWFHRKE